MQVIRSSFKYPLTRSNGHISNFAAAIIEWCGEFTTVRWQQEMIGLTVDSQSALSVHTFNAACIEIHHAIVSIVDDITTA